MYISVHMCVFKVGGSGKDWQLVAEKAPARLGANSEGYGRRWEPERKNFGTSPRSRQTPWTWRGRDELLIKFPPPAESSLVWVIGAQHIDVALWRHNATWATTTLRRQLRGGQAKVDLEPPHRLPSWRDELTKYPPIILPNAPWAQRIATHKLL